MAGLIQMVFSGEAGVVSSLHEHMQSLMPRSPHGTVKYHAKLQENADGVTARLSLAMPPEFLDELFGLGWRADAGTSTGKPAGHNNSDHAERYKIKYRESK